MHGNSTVVGSAGMIISIHTAQSNNGASLSNDLDEQTTSLLPGVARVPSMVDRLG
jgi:hypothetical protein